MSDFQLNRTEAILGFIEWMYQQPESVRYMVLHHCEFATDLIKIFCDTQGFDEIPRDGYQKTLVWPAVSFIEPQINTLATDDIVSRINEIISQTDDETADQAWNQDSPSGRIN